MFGLKAHTLSQGLLKQKTMIAGEEYKNIFLIAWIDFIIFIILIMFILSITMIWYRNNETPQYYRDSLFYEVYMTSVRSNHSISTQLSSTSLLSGQNADGKNAG